MFRARDLLKIKGRITIEKINKGIIISSKTYYNMIMNNALDELLKSFNNSNNSNILFKHVAFGDDDTPNNANMILLENEFFRIPILTKRRTGTGEITVRAVMTDLQPEYMGGACTIKEIGLFAGSGSYDFNYLAVGYQMNTGLLVSRLVVDEDKNLFEQIQVTWTISLERG